MDGTYGRPGVPSREMLTETGELLRELQAIRRLMPQRITFGIAELMSEVLPGLSRDEVLETAVLAGVCKRGKGMRISNLAVHVDDIPKIRDAARITLARRGSKHSTKGKDDSP